MIGGGPGGYVAAIKAAQLGFKVREGVSFDLSQSVAVAARTADMEEDRGNMGTHADSRLCVLRSEVHWEAHV